ncbi:MAG: trypsin-like peptidase domain-containing protein [Candidatus Paceibacterota bacterium]|jgi:S1-C subfamily serine protease
MKYFNILKKIKNVFSSPLMKIFFISFLTMIVTTLILLSIIWHYRARVFSFIASNYTLQSKAPNVEPVLIEKVTEAPATVASIEENKVEGTVVTAVKKARPAVVSIIISKQVPKYTVTYKEENIVYTPNGTEKKQLGSGSGFLISSDGMIVTNRHVVEQADVDYTVLLNNGKEYSAKVLARDSVLDVALIKITATGLPYLGLADSDKLEVGQSVVAIGNALGEFKNTVSSGVVSGLSRSLTATGSGGFQEFLYKVIQTDAAINPGNSGGPLLNLSGEVVGINVALAQGSSNIGFSLPINSVKSVIDQVKKTGKISRPYVGVRYVNVTGDLKAKLNLSVDYGILVAKGANANDVAVVPGSPADKAGIKEGDIILSIGGVALNQDNDFMSLIRNKRIGESLKFRVLSNGIERTVTIKLEEATAGL